MEAQEGAVQEEAEVHGNEDKRDVTRVVGRWLVAQPHEAQAYLGTYLPTLTQKGVTANVLKVLLPHEILPLLARCPPLCYWHTGKIQLLLRFPLLHLPTYTGTFSQRAFLLFARRSATTIRETKPLLSLDE